MFNYSEFVTLCIELLTEFGTEVTVNRISGSNYDPGLSQEILNYTEEKSVAVILDWSIGTLQVGGDRFLDNSDIIITDKRMIISANGLTGLQLGDQVFIDNTVYTIYEPLRKISPANVPIFYEANLRK